jgi:DNA repair protein RadC
MKRASSKKTPTRVREETPEYKRWKHPGGKLRELGPKALSTEELLAILISTGHRGKSAENIAEEIVSNYGSLESLSNISLAKLLEIKGLGDVKIVRIAAAFELARRIVKGKLEKYGSKEK